MGLSDFTNTATQDAINVLWWVDIAGLRVRYGCGSPTWNPSDTSTSRPIKDWMSDLIEVGAQSVEPLNGKTKGHTFTFALVDEGDAITSLVSTLDDTNAEWTTVTTACTLSHATLHVTATSAFTTPCDLFVGPETMRATDKTDTTFAVTRGMYSSTTTEHVLTDDAGISQSVFVWSAPRYIVGRPVKLYESRTGLDEEDAASIAGVIQSIDEAEGIWTFRAGGTLSRLSKMMNTSPAWAMAGPLGADWNPLLIRGGNGDFIAPTASVSPWIQIEDAIAAYSNIETATIGPFVMPSETRRMTLVFPAPRIPSMRLVPSSYMEGGEDEVEVKQIISHALFYDGTSDYTDPISALLCLLLSRTGDKTNHATYDILPKAIGLGLPSALVDVDAMEALRDTTHLGALKLRFVIDENTDLKKFAEEQILRPCMLFLVETWDGKISLKRLLTKNEAIVEGSSLDITEDMLLDMPDMSISMSPIGELRWKINHDPVEDEYMGELKVVFQESYDRYASAAKKYELECRSVHDPRIGKGGRSWRSSEYATMPEVIGRYICTAWDRFAVNPLPVIACEVPYNRLTSCVPGNVVRVTSTVTPNLSSSARGLVTEYFQIVECHPQPAKSSVALKLWQIGIHDMNTARVAPSAKVQSISNDFGGGGYARVYIYKSVFASKTDYADYELFTAGDKVRFLDQLGSSVDSTNYTVRSTGTSATYDFIMLEETDVDAPPSTEDGSFLDTTSYTSATATQKDYWCFESDASDELGGSDEGNQRS